MNHALIRRFELHPQYHYCQDVRLFQQARFGYYLATHAVSLHRENVPCRQYGKHQRSGRKAGYQSATRTEDRQRNQSAGSARIAIHQRLLHQRGDISEN